ncbi:hypothetical protein CAPTEDRAFT_208535 [Capitella teleta]|uniref:Uncharacterized protein n=1 Tax=Capitella teleta TaxID=283909 RepID=R7TFW3_CAPTE|nr:hypothetical protein CAPTEDRAFT_208535 [Capitella teleta]|eukprot:ELT92624.1 hypothetical protein CAPTEDRAFT_208535 [Capitella teleta]
MASIAKYRRQTGRLLNIREIKAGWVLTRGIKYLNYIYLLYTTWCDCIVSEALYQNSHQNKGSQYEWKYFSFNSGREKWIARSLSKLVALKLTTLVKGRIKGMPSMPILFLLSLLVPFVLPFSMEQAPDEWELWAAPKIAKRHPDAIAEAIHPRIPSKFNSIGQYMEYMRRFSKYINAIKTARLIISDIAPPLLKRRLWQSLMQATYPEEH